MSRLEQMINMQNELNNKTAGVQWKTGTTRDSRKINWRLCTIMESAEMLDSFPWKHWKDIRSEADIKNAKIEAVDIWHFILSETLETFSDQDCVEELMSPLVENFKKEFKSTETDNLHSIKVIESLIKVAAGFSSVEELTSEFFKTCQVLNLSYSELYRLYIGKNVLNSFRQNHGYKTGDYIKIWSGEEDNVVMERLLMENTNISVNELEDMLEVEYAKVS